MVKKTGRSFDEKGAFMSRLTPEPFDNRQPVAFSRRTFLLGSLAGAASLLLEPLWQDGDHFAYAADAANPEFKVFVVSNKEIGIATMDVTGNKNVPLPGAKITLAKYSDSKKTLSGTTDEDGNIVFNIETFGDVITLYDGEKVYQFDGSIDIVKDGYRRVSIKRIRCAGGSGMKVPTRLTTDQNYVYFKSMSFNDWDVQYTQNSFLRVEDLATTHDLAGEIEAPGKSAATVALIGKDDATGTEYTARSVNVTFNNGIGSFKETDHFLRPQSNVCLKKDTAYYYDVTFTDGEKYRFETGLSAIDPPIDTVLSGGTTFMAETQSTGDLPLVKLGAPIPEPLRGTLSVWRPTFPLLFYVTPLGYAMFGVSTKDLDWAKQSPLTDGSRWQRESSGSAMQQAERLLDRWDEQLDQFERLRAVSGGKGSACQFTSKITASIAAQAYLLSTFTWGEGGKWTGSLNALLQLSAGVTLTWTFLLGPVPFFVNFKPGIAALLSGSFGITSPAREPLNVSIDKDKTNLAFNITISVGIEFGIGLSGFISFSARGTGYFTVYVGFELKGGLAHLPLPRWIVGAGFNVEVIIQMTIFKWSGKLWSISWPRIYDRWANLDPQVAANEGSLPALAEDPLGFQLGAGNDSGPFWAHEGAVLNDEGSTGVTIEQFLKEAVIVTESELAKTAEVSAKQKAGFTAPPITIQQPQEIGDGLFVADMTDLRPYLLGDALEEFEYEYIGQDEDAVCSFTAGAAGVAGTGEEGGVKPTVDTRLSRNIFSNPLQKTALFHSTPYMFRIVSVTYKIGSETLQRTRLSAQRYNADTGKWERPKVIDVPLNVTVNGKPVTRTDLFDYDFDVIAQSEGLSSQSVPNGLHVLLVSGTRPSGDASSFTDVAASQVMTWLVLDEYLQLTASYTWADTAGATGSCSSPSVPRMVTLPAKDGADTSARALAALFLRRSAATPESLFGDASSATAECLLLSGMKVFQGGRINVNPQAYDLVLSANTGTVGKTTTDLSFAVASRSRNAGVRITTVNLTVSNDLASKKAADVTKDNVKFSSVENVGDRTDVTDLKVWPNHSAFLTVSDGILYASTFDPKVEHGTLTTRQVGPSSSRLASFMVSQNGNVLFYTENREGDCGQTFDADGNAKPVKVNIHTVRASILCDDLFSESFPLTETKHPLDSLMSVNGGQSYTFLSTHITNLETSSADLYYLDVPVVATATPIGFAAVHQFVEQGDPNAAFEMTLRNDGNVILKGCVIDLVEVETGKTVDTRDFSFAQENLCASAWNPELYDDPDEDLVALIQENAQKYPPECLAAAARSNDGPHVFADPAANGVLLPGKTGLYQIKFAIPQEWHGTKLVYLRLRDYAYETVVTAVDTEEEIPVLHYTAPYHESFASEIPVHGQAGDEDHGLRDPGAWKVGPNGELISVDSLQGNGTNAGNNAGGNAGANAGSSASSGSGANAGNKAKPNSGQNKTSNMAPTGDATIPVVAGLAATAAAAGLVAYSARRTALEQEARQQDEENDNPDGE